ncbi:MAG: hypothetical protein ACI31S_06215 [Bacilli bacterium]
MRNIGSEIILQKKISSVVYVYVMIIIILTLSLIIFVFFKNYQTYYNAKGIVTEENNYNYVKVYISLDDIKYLLENSIVLLNNRAYNYEIIYADNEYYTDNIKTYQIITLKLELEEKYQINNLSLDLKFPKEDKKIINYIIKK